MPAEVGSVPRPSVCQGAQLEEHPLEPTAASALSSQVSNDQQGAEISRAERGPWYHLLLDLDLCSFSKWEAVSLGTWLHALSGGLLRLKDSNDDM